MNQKALSVWFSVVAILIVFFGLLYMALGLSILPIDESVKPDYDTELYGAVLAGWGVTMFLVGRVAFEKNSKELKQAMFVGAAVWLLGEALFSFNEAYWLNVGVDAAFLALIAAPLLLEPKQSKKEGVKKSVKA